MNAKTKGAKRATHTNARLQARKESLEPKVEGAIAEPPKEEPTEGEAVVPDEPTLEERIEAMNDHIQRLFNGQSQSLGMADRSARVRFSMKRHDWLDLVEYLDIDESHRSQLNHDNKKLADYL